MELVDCIPNVKRTPGNDSGRFSFRMKLTKEKQKTYWVCPGCKFRTRKVGRFDLHLRTHGSVFLEEKWKDLAPWSPGPARKKR